MVAQARTENALQTLTQTVSKMQVVLGDLRGDVLERKYQDKAYSYFGPLLRRVRVVSLQALEDELRSCSCRMAGRVSGRRPWLRRWQNEDVLPEIV